MSKLEDFDDATLRDELKRREKEAVLRIMADNERRNAILREGLTFVLINALAPAHTASSCSDSNVSNGFCYGDYVPRCVRCGLLDVMSKNLFLPSDVTIEVIFRKNV